MEKIESNEVEISGVSLWLYPDDFAKGEERTYGIRGLTIEQTQWGNKGILTLIVEKTQQEYKLCTWNMAMQVKCKFNAETLINKRLICKEFTEKKLKCALI